ncbi:putative exoribonuclease II [Dioscorea sansibarensis]
MGRLGLQASTEIDTKARDPQVVALACKMVGGGSDGSLDLCARVCLIDEDENIIFHSYVKPQIPVTNYRFETTGIRTEHLRDAPPLKQVQRKIQDFLCNGEAIWKIRSRGGKARILVGHGLDHDLNCLGIDYPALLIRYDIQTGMQDPYDDCVAAFRLYNRMRSQVHPPDYSSGSGEAQSRNNFASWRQRDLEKMTPEALLEISASDYYCWCLDSSSK